MPEPHTTIFRSISTPPPLRTTLLGVSWACVATRASAGAIGGSGLPGKKTTWWKCSGLNECTQISAEPEKTDGRKGRNHCNE